MTLQEEIIRKLTRDIRTGVFPVGTRLPTQQQLCERFDVSRITVSQALKKLEYRGLIEIRQGAGSFVRANDDSDNAKTGRIAFVGNVDGEVTTILLRVLCSLAEERDLKVLAIDTRMDAEREQEQIEQLQDDVDGMIVDPAVPAANPEGYIRHIHDGPPIVFAHRYLPAVRISNATADNVAGACEAARHLLDLGYEQIAYLAGPDADRDSSGLDRIAGCRKAVKEADVPDASFRQWLMPDDDTTADTVRRTLEAAVENGRLAVICSHEPWAWELTAACDRAGLDIPRQVGMVCFRTNGTERYAQADLTTVWQEYTTVAEKAFNLLMEQMEAERRIYREVRVPCRLEVGGTCGAQLQETDSVVK